MNLLALCPLNISWLHQKVHISQRFIYTWIYKRLYIHVIIDLGTGMILTWSITPSNVHDSKHLEPLLDPAFSGRELYLDSAYLSLDKLCGEYGITAHICERGTSGHHLTEEQRERNSRLSSKRCLVEHVFYDKPTLM